MDLYDLLTKLVENTTIGDKTPAFEVIQKLKGVNAFGSVVAATESDTKEAPHVHNYEQRWVPYNPNMVQDVCMTCGDKTKPREPRMTGRKW